MKTKLFQNKLYVKKSTVHGYGVFAGKNIKKGELLEECYPLLSTNESKDHGWKDIVFDMNDKTVLLTGYGSIYNHSSTPNVSYTFLDDIAIFIAKQRIYKGQELFVSYGKEWFSGRDIQELRPPVKWGFYNPVTFLLLRVLLVSSGIFLSIYFLKHFYMRWVHWFLH
jgi:hypothetical protein